MWNPYIKFSLGLGCFLIALFSTTIIAEAPSPILYGTETNQGDWPWIADLTVDGEDNRWFCAGSLIHPLVILTAAHCVWNERSRTKVKPHEVSVVLNRVNLSDKSVGVTPEVSSIQVHWLYEQTLGDNDIAFLELKNWVYGITPISVIPNDSVADNPSQAYYKVRVLGWGKTETGYSSNTLNRVDLTLVDSNLCDYRGFPQKNLFNVLCTKDYFKGIGSGDSGGPLLIYEDGTFYLAGVISWGSTFPQADGYYYGLYTGIRHFLDWFFTEFFFLRPDLYGYKKIGGSDSSFTDGQMSVISNPEKFNLSPMKLNWNFINALPAGWHNLGTEHEISSFDLFSAVAVVWQFQNGFWKFYSPDESKRSILRTQYQEITQIESGTGIWILK